MGITENPRGFDQSFDVIVVGSGAGGMTAALTAQAEGLSAVVLEKSDQYGGTTAVSGGGIWIPCNDQMAAAGISDSPEEALTYVSHLTEGQVPQARLAAYVHTAVEMVRFLEQKFSVRFRSVAKYPDYFPLAPGGKPGARTMEPVAFDATQLGAEFERQRPPFRGTLVLGRMAMDQVQAHVLFSRSKGWIWLILTMMWRYWTDFAWRKRTWRDRRLVLGQGLVGALRHAMGRYNVPLQLNTAFEDLITDAQGRVVGVRVQRGGKTLQLGARRGVVLACGGFESNQALRERFLPKPTQVAWSAAPPVNHGEGIQAGAKLGAQLGFMNMVWGVPTILVPGNPTASPLFVERSLPGCLMVNAQGERFLNEAAPYTEAVASMLAEQAKSGGAIPTWLIFDARFREKYPCGPLLPGNIAPDKKLPKIWEGTVYFKADTLDALAEKIKVNPQGLQRSVSRMNAFAASGKDTDFGKGDNVFDRYYADPMITPNPCLAPLSQGPFYAIPLQTGEIGTKGGLVADETARVLREDGSVIPGLYAIGNCSAAAMGKTYPGPGATLGPAMTFGYLAAKDLAKLSAAVMV